ncbi:MAG TPA: TadE/TadG family type IV pilus assembly protein [Candidatus Gastranaerophilales bacterium]|nr:TadE/TadG family type IV pilus assembly protein [Candidatus Gastranaerophilales bacterium]
MKNFSLKTKKAQQLIEFALVVPILMIILFIIIEFGTAINARATVGEGVKIALTGVNNLSGINGNTATKITFAENYIKNEIIKYLIQHNIPNSGSVVVKVKATANYAVVLVNYQYNPYFFVPGLLGGAIPSSINFSSSQTLNSHIFQPNVFSGAARSTAQLANFHTDGGGNFLESGALISGDIHGNGFYDVRNNTAFLVHFYDGIGTHPNLEYDRARLVSWNGVDLLPPNLRINVKTGALEVRSPYYNNAVWFNTRIPYIWAVSALGINHLLYTKYNSFDMLMADNSTLYYKLLFNSTDAFYNRGIRFCGTTGSSGVCNGDQRGRATVNERTLRMNPRLGAPDNNPDNGNNDYIAGTMEPVFVPSNPTHHFQHINSSYFSYTTDFLNWNYTTWQNQFFVTVSSPRVLGLPERPSDMADDIYHADITNINKTPFYKPYEYRFRMVEAPAGPFVPTPGNLGGIFWGVAVAAGTNDGRIDAHNTGYAFDAVGGVENAGAYINYYTVDIVDIYTDSDGDGIPDAWDRDPAHFDVNTNGILDGNELNMATLNSDNRCNDGIGNPLKYLPDTNPLCSKLPDTIAVGAGIDYDGDTVIDYTPAAGDFTAYNASPGKPFWKATPYKINGAINTLASGANVPLNESMALVKYTGDGTNALYYNTGGGNYTRRHPTWWQDGTGACWNTGNDQFDIACVKARRKIKAGTGGGTKFIHGTVNNAVNPTIINIDPSQEFQYLHTNNIISPNSHTTRTPPNVW